MIEINGVDKHFGEVKALDHIVASIHEGSIFGMVGTNGAGKSTLLRIMSGVLEPDAGNVLLDGEEVYENPKAKAKICFLICPLSSRQVKYLKVSDKNTYISFWSVGIFMHTISLYIF